MHVVKNPFLLTKMMKSNDIQHQILIRIGKIQCISKSFAKWWSFCSGLNVLIFFTVSGRHSCLLQNSVIWKTTAINPASLWKAVLQAVYHHPLSLTVMVWTKRPGHTALYGLITGKTRQKVVSREADDVVRVDVEFKTSYSWFIDMAGRGEKSERRWTRQKVLNCSKFYSPDNHGWHTW